MSNTIRSLADLLSILPSAKPGGITAQNLRDVVVTAFGRVYIASGMPGATYDAADTANVGRIFQAGDLYYSTTYHGVYICTDATATAAQWDIITDPTVIGAYLPITGGTLTGALEVLGDITLGTSDNVVLQGSGTVETYAIQSNSEDPIRITSPVVMNGNAIYTGNNTEGGYLIETDAVVLHSGNNIALDATNVFISNDAQVVGQVKIRDDAGFYNCLDTEEMSSGDVISYLPASGGTLATTADLGDYLPLAGGTMLGNLDMGGYQVLNAGTVAYKDPDSANYTTVTCADGISSNYALTLPSTNGNLLCDQGITMAPDANITLTGSGSINSAFQVQIVSNSTPGQYTNLFYSGSGTTNLNFPDNTTGTVATQDYVAGAVSGYPFSSILSNAGITPAADGTYSSPTSITIQNGIITAIS